ncbi:HlyD family secretion protein (plasmid) [Pseudomonas luteola]|uniref:HlyD family secretion protein n=1 Tax=Pseudomonas luteola TaxID=47886 RepID=UPI00388D7D05
MRTKVRLLSTVVLICLAGFFGRMVWTSYVYSPWTRDARVRAKVVTIAPDESGWVTKVFFKDNQYVEKGQVIFEIDNDLIKAELAEQQAVTEKARRHYELTAMQYSRRMKLVGIGAISAEDLDTRKTESLLAKAEYEIAQAKLQKASTRLMRTKIIAPSSGRLMNLTLQPGNYVRQGSPVLSLVDEQSFYVTGYFEETTLPRIHIGQPAKIYLTSGDKPLTGKVKGISPGIANTNLVADEQMLPQVQQAFNWVRLSQRIPVDIQISRNEYSGHLVAGMGASVQLQDD